MFTGTIKGPAVCSQTREMFRSHLACCILAIAGCSSGNPGASDADVGDANHRDAATDASVADATIPRTCRNLEVVTNRIEVATAAGDLNGDGRDDLVSVGDVAGDSFVDVRLADGGGGFGAPASYAIPQFPSDAEIADVDGDGHLDVLVMGGLELSLLRGLGDGSLASAVTAGSSAKAIEVADLDGDGVLDLAADDFGTVKTRLGNGDGSFRAGSSIAVGVGDPDSLAVGRLDDDTLPDLVVADFNQDDVSVMVGQAGGGLGAPASFAITADPAGVAIADFDHDGRNDLAITRFAAGELAIRRGDGMGGFGNMPDVVVGLGANAIISADLDADGFADLIVTRKPSASEAFVTFLRGRGDGSFDVPVDHAVGGAHATASNPALGDFDGDGVRDVAVSNGGSGNLNVLFGPCYN